MFKYIVYVLVAVGFYMSAESTKQKYCPNSTVDNLIPSVFWPVMFGSIMVNGTIYVCPEGNYTTIFTPKD